MKKKDLITLGVTFALVVIGYAGWRAWNASRNLVTLNVQNADVREVVEKIGRQTRETILMDSNVQGKITLQAKRATLEKVLGIITDQISARWQAYYPIYSGGASLDRFKQGLRGDIDPATSGWTNLQSRGGMFGGRGGGPGGFGGGGPGFGERSLESTQRITLNIEGKDAQFAALAINRFAQTRIVPEDGANTLVMLKLDKAKVPDAVALLAKKAQRSWAKVYVLQGFPDFGRGGGEFTRRGDRGERPPGEEGGRRGGPDWFNMTDEEREKRRLEREAVEKELTQTLPPEAQAKAAEQQQQRDQFRQEMASMANLSEDERRARFEQMRASGQFPGGRGGGGNRDQARMERIKNTTPEQKAQRYQQMQEWRARREQQRGTGR